MKKLLVLLLFTLVPLVSPMPHEGSMEYWYDTYPNWALWDTETQEVVIRMHILSQEKVLKKHYMSPAGIKKRLKYQTWKKSVPRSYYEGLKS